MVKMKIFKTKLMNLCVAGRGDMTDTSRISFSRQKKRHFFLTKIKKKI